MKKNIFKLSFLLVMCGFALVSCDKEDTTSPDSPEPKAVTATVEYSMPDRYDLSKYFDLMAYYTNKEGKEVSEAITSATWKKSITNAPVPGTYQLKIVYTRNSVELTQDVYKVGRGLSLSYITSAGKQQSSNHASTLNVGKDKIEEFLKKITEETTSVEIPE